VPQQAVQHSAVTVRSGAVIALRLFDIAYAIDLVKVEALWAQRAARAASRSRFVSAPSKAVAFDVPPVQLELEPVQLELEGRRHSLSVGARVYDFGAVALALRLPVADLGWERYAALFEAMDQAVGPRAPTPLWDAQLAQLRQLLGAAFDRPSLSTLQEDYLLAIVHGWNEPLDAAAIPERVDLAQLLSGEKRPLSPGARRELLRQHFSYYEDDLVVLTWDRAFICEPRGDSDVADALEVANAQLLELRYYDELLDDELPRMYELVQHARRDVYVLAPRRFAHLARRLYTLVAEVTELREKVDNALQVTEDVYLARVYSAALELFRVEKLGAGVDRKLAIIRDTYAALYEEASGVRGELLELAIVILIVIELVLALVRVH
jgi:hypothetical protein